MEVAREHDLGLYPQSSVKSSSDIYAYGHRSLRRRLVHANCHIFRPAAITLHQKDADICSIGIRVRDSPIDILPMVAS